MKGGDCFLSCYAVAGSDKTSLRGACLAGERKTLQPSPIWRERGNRVRGISANRVKNPYGKRGLGWRSRTVQEPVRIAGRRALLCGLSHLGWFASASLGEDRWRKGPRTAQRCSSCWAGEVNLKGGGMDERIRKKRRFFEDLLRKKLLALPTKKAEELLDFLILLIAQPPHRLSQSQAQHRPLDPTKGWVAFFV